MTEQPRHPAGAPTGGQFATTTRSEGAVALAAPTLEALDIAPGDALYLSAADAGTDIIDSVEIVHEDDGAYRADGAVTLNFLDAYREIAGVDDTVQLEPGSDEMLAAATWLEDHSPVLEAFLRERYDAELDGSCEEWAHQRLVFSAALDPAVDTTDTVAARVETDTKAIQAYNESDRGTFGVPYLWAEARRHVEAWNADVEAAQRGYLADKITDRGLPWGQSLDRANALPAEHLDQGADVVRRFMREQHDVVQRARTVHLQQHGTELEPMWIGRDVSLVLNNPADTPHGRLAFSALPSDLQARMQETVRRYAGES